jgi:hypothetical protein
MRKHTHGTSFIRVSAANLDRNGGSAGTCLDGMRSCELDEVRDADLFLIREITKVAAKSLEAPIFTVLALFCEN